MGLDKKINIILILSVLGELWGFYEIYVRGPQIMENELLKYDKKNQEYITKYIETNNDIIENLRRTFDKGKEDLLNQKKEIDDDFINKWILGFSSYLEKYTDRIISEIKNQ